VSTSTKLSTYLVADGGRELQKLARLLPDPSPEAAKAKAQQFKFAIEADRNLEDASFPSILKCALDCFTLDLWPGPKGHMYLIAFAGKATAIPGYKGLVTLARRGLNAKIRAHVVYDQEPYDYRAGTDDEIDHTPLPPSQRGSQRVAAYAVAHSPGGEQFVWLWAEEVEAIKAKAPGSKKRDSPWNSSLPHEVDEMWKKTAIRRLSKILGDDDPRLGRAVELMDNAEGYSWRKRRTTTRVQPVNAAGLLTNAATYVEPDEVVERQHEEQPSQ
jgi:phage RecT family recombinase